MTLTNPIDGTGVAPHWAGRFQDDLQTAQSHVAATRQLLEARRRGDTVARPINTPPAGALTAARACPTLRRMIVTTPEDDGIGTVLVVTAHPDDVHLSATCEDVRRGRPPVARRSRNEEPGAVHHVVLVGPPPRHPRRRRRVRSPRPRSRERRRPERRGARLGPTILSPETSSQRLTCAEEM